MNLPNVQKLRDHLAALLNDGHGDQFRMDGWIFRDDEHCSTMKEAARGPRMKPINECDTVACLAGWSAILCYNETRESIERIELRKLSVRTVATNWLDLDFQTAGYWFSGGWSNHPQQHITLDEAVGFLDRMIRSAESDPGFDGGSEEASS